VSSLRFGPYRVELSNLDKVLFPEAGITKGDLVEYYRRVAGRLVPHLENRPLTLHRFPDGIGEDGFYQQAAADYFPDWIATVEVERASGSDAAAVRHALCNNAATLVYLANQGTVALHGWLARAPELERPDRLLFDLDPPGDDFAAVRRAARAVAGLMQELGLTPFAMTTGSRGLHVAAPLRPEWPFDRVRELAKDMADWLARRHPDQLTVEQRKAKRGGRIYLDVMRNAYGQTAVAPYSVRALPGAPVATPLALDELEDSALGPQRWTIRNLFRRLGQKDDPWADIGRHAAAPERARDVLSELLGDRPA